MAVRSLGPAGGAVAGLDHIAGLGAHDGQSAGVLVLDPPQEPVGEDLSLRMVRGGGGLIGVGAQHLPAQVVAHGGLQNGGHVGDGAGVGLVKQPHAVGEVGGVGEAQILQLVVHHLHKGLVGSGHIGGKAHGRVGAGGEDGAVEQLPDGDGLVNHQPNHAAPVDVAVVGDLSGHGEGVVQIGFLDGLGGHQDRQDLGHGSGIDHRVRALFRQDLMAVQVDQHRIDAGQLLAQLDGAIGGGIAGRDLRFLCYRRLGGKTLFGRQINTGHFLFLRGVAGLAAQQQAHSQHCHQGAG